MKYIFVADEMGTPGMAFGTSNTFVFGGYVIHKHEVPEAVKIWRGIKQEMCGRVDVELKWKHFFVAADDPKMTPLKILRFVHVSAHFGLGANNEAKVARIW